MKIIQDYFNFTVAETRAALLLLSLTPLFAYWPLLLPVKAETTDFSLLERVLDSLENSKKQDSIRISGSRERFYFDPNTAEAEDLNRLGFAQVITARIVKFRNAGGKFRTAADLYRMYGIDSSFVAGVLPLIRIEKQHSSTYKVNKSRKQSKTGKFEIIELNTADTAALEALPLIGTKLAARILAFRNKLRGFYSPVQLQEVYGLRPETFSVIEKLVKADPLRIDKIQINRCTYEVLAAHPYIGFRKASLLIAYRKQHGIFKSMDDLSKACAGNLEHAAKLHHYIDFGTET